MDSQKNDQHTQKNMGYTMIIAMWVLIFALLAFLFQDVLDKQYNPNKQQISRLTTDNIRELVLQRNHFGHYVVDGLINNQAVTFLLDTGATDVSIPAKTADKLGLQRGKKMVYQTANGKAAVFATTINQISIGNIELENIRATINPNVKDMDVLLGMSFLKKLEFTQRGNTLTIKQYPNEY